MANSPAPQHSAFDTAAELATVRKRRAVTKRRRWRQHQLDPFRAELVALRCAGASFPDLVVWLRLRKITTSHTTVLRYLRKLPEMTGGQNCDHQVGPGTAAAAESDRGPT